MYRLSIDYDKNIAPSHLSFSELNSLDVKCMEELHLDTKSLSDHNVSVNMANSSVFSFAPLEDSRNTTTTGIKSSQHNSFFASDSSVKKKSIGNALNMTIKSKNDHVYNNNIVNNKNCTVMTKQISRPFQQSKQQHRSVLTPEQQQIWKQDEISNSLKMFATLSAYNGGNEQLIPQSRVDSVMQDFACNGYTSDKINRYQQYQAAINIANGGLGDYANAGIFPATANLNYNNKWCVPQNQQNLNMDLNNIRNDFWRLFPIQMEQISKISSPAATAAANIDYNFNANNSNGTFSTKKTYNKRNAKQEKYASVKHCVFCENNNEPEAVVKSHAVRDTLGRVLCPKLRTYTCPICKISGDYAHTVKYCPKKPIITMEDAMKAESLRLTKNLYKQTK